MTDNTPKISHSHKTQRAHTAASYSELLQKLTAIDQLGKTALDCGSGYGHSYDILEQYGMDAKLYEPFYHPNKKGSKRAPDFSHILGSDIVGQYDLVMATYVINVLGDTSYWVLLHNMIDHVNKGGVIAISSACKSMVKVSDTVKSVGLNRVVTSVGTMQTYRSSDEIFADLLTVATSANRTIKALPIRYGMVSMVIKVD